MAESAEQTFRDHLQRARDTLKHCGIKDDQIEVKLGLCEEELRKLNDPAPAENTESRLINDAIHGPVELTWLVYKIINTPEFHRLKDIKQLGGSNYVYPGANHTRFDHSIGVYHLAGEFAKHLQAQMKIDKCAGAGEEEQLLWKFTEQEVLCAEIAGLCHDLGHGPLSHMFERYILDKLVSMRHEEISIILFRRLLAENIPVLAEFVNQGLGENDVKLIELMMKPEKDKKLPEPWKCREFLCEIVANKHTGLDVDKWDYYARDCYYLGITNDFQQRRCMLLGRIVKKENGELHIAFRDKELDNIYGMFRTRGILHQKAYQHKTIKAVERMIADAIMTVKKVKLIRVFGSAEPKSIEEAVQEMTEGNAEAYLGLTDSIVGMIKFYHFQPGTTVTEETALEEAALQKCLQQAKLILRRIELRDLYACSGKIRVPKMLSETGAAHEGQRSDPIAGAQNHHNGHLWRAMQAMKLQPQGETIHDLLDHDAKQRIKINDIWIEFEMIKVPSEGNDNPVDKVTFYKKPKGKNVSPAVLEDNKVKAMTSMLVVPQAFVECEVRLYDKREAKKRSNEDRCALEKALSKWKEQADIQHNGHSSTQRN